MTRTEDTAFLICDRHGYAIPAFIYLSYTCADGDRRFWDERVMGSSETADGHTDERRRHGFEHSIK